MAERLITTVDESGIIHSITTNNSIPRFQVVGTHSGSYLIGDGNGILNIDPTHISFVSTSIIQQQSHLPTPINNIITLASNTQYFLFGTINLEDGIKINSGLSSGLIGFNAPTDKLIGNVDGPLVTIIDDGSNAVSHVYFATIQNNNTGSNSVAIKVSASLSSTFVAQESRIISSGKAGIDVYNCANTKIANTAVIGKDGIVINPGVGSILLDNISSQTTVISGSAINILSGSALSVFTIQNSAVLGLIDSSQKGIKIFNTGSIASGKFDTVINFGPQTFNSGWDQTVVGYSVRDCPSLPNSTNGGGSYLTISGSSMNSTLNSYVDIANGSNLYALDPGSERFILNSQVNGEIKFIGTKTRKFLVTAGVSFILSAGVGTVRFAIFKNGVLVASTVAEASSQLTRFSALTTIPVLLDASPNDVFKIRMMNLDSSLNVIFQSVGITVACLGI